MSALKQIKGAKGIASLSDSNPDNGIAKQIDSLPEDFRPQGIRARLAGTVEEAMEDAVAEKV
jgi:hypothetical protein